MQYTGEESDGLAWRAELNSQGLAVKERTVEALPTRNSEERQLERYKHSIGVQSHKDRKDQCGAYTREAQWDEN